MYRKKPKGQQEEGDNVILVKLIPFPKYPNSSLSKNPRRERSFVASMDSNLPDDFRCPISLEIMTDPVVLTSGHTFDRPSIQRWLDGGNLTCPVTNIPLPSPHPPLIPNHALRRLILHSHPNRPPAPGQIPKSPPCPKLLLNSLSYPSDPTALSSLLRSVQKSAEFRQKVADSNIPTVLLRHVASSQHPELQKLAIYSILYLSLDGDDVKVGLVAEGAVDCLVTAVKSDCGAAAAAATVITSLATVDVNKVTIGAHPSAIASLALMLLEGSTKREKKEAATAIYELCKFPENRRRAVRAGSVRSLVKLAGSGLDRAVEVLAQLAKNREGRAEMGKIDGFVRVLVGVLGRGTDRGAESSLSVLSLVCGDDEKMGLAAIGEGILGILERISNEEGGQIGKNAAALLEKLR